MPIADSLLCRGKMVFQAKIGGENGALDFTYQCYERFEKHRLGKTVFWPENKMVFNSVCFALVLCFQNKLEALAKAVLVFCID